MRSVGTTPVISAAQGVSEWHGSKTRVDDLAVSSSLAAAVAGTQRGRSLGVLPFELSDVPHQTTHVLPSMALPNCEPSKCEATLAANLTDSRHTEAASS